MGHGISFWKARRSNMTSVSSDVTMTAFEPVRAACSACKSKHVSTFSCVDCSSATSIHSSAVILKQVSSQVTYNVLLLPFILCTRPIPSVMQVDGVRIASAGDTFWVDQDILHIYTYTLRYQDHLAEEVSVILPNHMLAFHSECLCADC